MGGQFGPNIINLCVDYVGLGKGREQGCGSVYYVLHLDLDHFYSKLDSSGLMQRILN